MLPEPPCEIDDIPGVSEWAYLAPIRDCYKQCIENLTDRVVLEWVFAYNRAKIKTHIYFREVRKTYPAVNMICGIVETVSRWISRGVKWLLHRRVEPDCDSWISRYSYNPKDNTTNEAFRKFRNQSLTEWPLVDFQEVFQTEYRGALSSANPEYSNLIVARVLPELTRIKRFETADAGKDLIVVKRANVSFLSVEYCFDRQNSVTIDIPKTHYVVGNELLSDAYVIRHLEHLPVYLQWTFDGKYQLKIIDENLNTVVLNETQWVLLTEDDYVVCSEEDSRSVGHVPGENKVRFAEDEETKEYEKGEDREDTEESDPLFPLLREDEDIRSDLKPKID